MSRPSIPSGRTGTIRAGQGVETGVLVRRLTVLALISTILGGTAGVVTFGLGSVACRMNAALGDHADGGAVRYRPFAGCQRRDAAGGPWITVGEPEVRP